jgi:hypothetical protein
LEELTEGEGGAKAQCGHRPCNYGVLTNAPHDLPVQETKAADSERARGAKPAAAVLDDEHEVGKGIARPCGPHDNG